MDTPRLEINLQKLRHNTRTIVNMCENHGLSVVGVTKGVSAIPQVARAMLDGGVSGLADARVENVEKLRDAGISAPIMLLRLPRISRVDSIVHLTDTSLNSEWSTMRYLFRESRKTGHQHGVILMIDVGDLREGVMYSHAMRGLRRILSSNEHNLLGIGTNVGCYGGVLPSEKNMGHLAQIAREIKKQFSVSLPVVTVGGTNCLSLIEEGKMPSEINQIRIGEGILLGRDSSLGRVLEGTYQDAFELVSEIVEIKSKPSQPIGSIGRDAFGNKPVFKNRGVRRRALIALGKQDVRVTGLISTDKHLRVLGGSSDYLILDIGDSEQHYQIGDEVRFHLLYPGLLSVSTSPFVTHVFKED